MNPAAVYYPYFFPQEDVWLASALLWWDKLYLIWPPGVGTSNEVVQELIERGVIDTIDPSDAVTDSVSGFVREVLDPSVDSLATKEPSFGESIYLLRPKVEPLIEYLEQHASVLGKRYQIVDKSNLKLDKEIEVRYMSFLADRLAKDPSRAGDAPEADTVTNDPHYLRYHGGVRTASYARQHARRGLADQAIMLAVMDVLVELEDFTLAQVDHLENFRKENAKERKRFREDMALLLASVQEASALIGAGRSAGVERCHTKVLDGLKGLEVKLEALNLRTRRQCLGVLVAGGVNAAHGALRAGPPAHAAGAALTAAVATGIGIGVTACVANDQRRETLDESPFTYLYQVKRRFGRRGMIARAARKVISAWRHRSDAPRRPLTALDTGEWLDHLLREIQAE